jgi:hypothetical protein
MRQHTHRVWAAFAVLTFLFSSFAAYAADDYIYDIADNVPASQVALIKEALVIAQAFADKSFAGGGIPAAVRAKITVKIEATGLGNQEEGGGGGVATALAVSGIRPYFDVAHEQWNQNSEGRGWTTKSDSMKSVAHEYAHAWQSWLGAMTIHSQPLGNWINEGIGEYLGYAAMVDAGKMSWRKVMPFVLGGAVGAETDRQLKDFGTSRSPVWAGHVGMLAIDWLVAESPNGLQSLEIIAKQVAAGKSQAAAFKTAFNIELADFYTQFEAWRAIIVSNPSSALKKRPALINIGE